MFKKYLATLNKNMVVKVGLMLTAVGIISVIAGFAVFVFTRQLTLAGLAVSGENGPQLSANGEVLQPGETGVPGETRPLAPDTEPELAPWDGAGRVTILLLGLDYRDWESGNDYSRSDTMILLTLDPLSRKAGILSVPRDLWVAIPGFEHAKINTAYYLGDAYKLPGGGPGLAVKTVEEFLGVPINFYAQIDFGAFVKFIDEIGGVKINVPEPITIDLLGSGSATKKTLQGGVQVLPGEWALAYARARYTEGGDFDRAARQQQVILAIRDRILSFDMLPILVQKANVLYEQLAAGVHTNLSLDQIVKLALLAGQVQEEDIQRGIIGKEYVLFGQSPDNLSILIPLPDKIHSLRDQIFTASGAMGPLTPGSIQEKMVSEAASVAVYNGSLAGDLAERTAEYLRSQGMDANQAGNGQATTLTTLIDHSGSPFTARFLVDLMKINSIKIIYEDDPNSPVDIELILGDDWARSNPMP
jgi:LCP family protein required for cell wall assembly